MFKLIDDKGQTVKMKRTGEPFIYTTRATADMGRAILARRRKLRLKVVTV